MKVSAVLLVTLSAFAAAQTGGVARPTGGLTPTNGTSPTTKPTSSTAKVPSAPTSTPSGDKEDDKSAAGMNTANSVAALVLAVGAMAAGSML